MFFKVFFSFFKVFFSLVSAFFTYYAILLIHDPHSGGIETLGFILFEPILIILMFVLSFVKEIRRWAMIFMIWNLLLVISLIIKFQVAPPSYPYGKRALIDSTSKQ